jgi:Flp pilus assembly protein TadG
MQSYRFPALNRDDSPPDRRGAMFVLATVSIVLLLAMAVISVDVSFMQLTRTELQIASDAAAKAGAEALLRTQDPDAARKAAIQIASQNFVAGKPLLLTDADIELGNSRLLPNGSWEFSSSGAPFNSVRINASLSEANANGSVPYFLASFFGRTSFSPQTTSTAANMEQDLYLVLDRSHSMCFDLSGVDWVYPPGHPKNPHPIAFPPHPKFSRWAVLVDSVDLYLSIAANANPRPRIGLVTWSSDIGTNTAEYYYTKVTEVAVKHDLPFTTNYSLLMSGIRGRSAKVMLGGTNMHAGMQEGITQLLKGRRFSHKTMILMTDGQWNLGENPLLAAQRAKSNGITINTITFLPGAIQPEMEEIARITGGRHYHADNAAELRAVFVELARTLPVVLTN